jgi:signal transduction histidine kinase
MPLRAIDVDPRLFKHFVSIQVFSSVFQTLVRLSERGEAVPDLATHWDVSVDGRTYRFQLNENARFHDGEPVVARNVVLSLARLLWPSSPSNLRGFLVDLVRGARGLPEGAVPEGLRALDAATVEIELLAPYPAFVKFLATPNLSVVRLGEQGVCLGSGPLVPNFGGNPDELHLTIFDQYTGSRPRSQDMVVRRYRTVERLVWAVEHGELDATVALRRTPPQFPAAGSRLVTTRVGIWATDTLFFNFRNPLAHDAAFRRDCGALLSGVAPMSCEGDTRARPSSAFLPPEIMPDSYYVREPAPSLAPASFAARWRRALAGRELRLLPPEPQAPFTEALRALGTALAADGVRLRVAAVDSFQEILDLQHRGAWDMAVRGYFPDFLDPDGMVSLLEEFDPGEGRHAFGPFLRALAEARVLPGAEERLCVYERLFRELEGRGLFFPMIAGACVIVHDPAVMVSPNPFYPYDNEATLAREVLHYQDQLRLSERNAAVARAAQMLAHDVRRPLSLMRVGLDMLRTAESSERLREIAAAFVPEVAAALVSVEGMIRDVMAVGSTAPPELAPESLRGLLASALDQVLEGERDADVDLAYDLGHTHQVEVEAPAVLRVFVNIIDNALQAMHGKGRLWLRTREVRDASRELVEVCIGNSGPLIDPADRARLFEAFFTKGKRGGTGLGLAIAYKVVRSHGGRIWCTSSAERGTEFWLTLSLHASRDVAQPWWPKAGRARRASGRAAASGGSGAASTLVALVEDNAFLREAWTVAMSDARLRAFAEPAAFWAAVAGEPRLLEELAGVVTDYWFGDDAAETGIDLARGIKAKAPSLPIVLCTDADTQGLALPPGVIDLKADKTPVPWRELALRLSDASPGMAVGCTGGGGLAAGRGARSAD